MYKINITLTTLLLRSCLFVQFRSTAFVTTAGIRSDRTGPQLSSRSILGTFGVLRIISVFHSLKVSLNCLRNAILNALFGTSVGIERRATRVARSNTTNVIPRKRRNRQTTTMQSLDMIHTRALEPRSWRRRSRRGHCETRRQAVRGESRTNARDATDSRRRRGQRADQLLLTSSVWGESAVPVV